MGGDGDAMIKIPPSAMLDDVLQNVREPAIEAQRPENRPEPARELDQYEPEFRYAIRNGLVPVKEMIKWFEAHAIGQERSVVYALLYAVVQIKAMSEQGGKLNKGIATACEMLRRMASELPLS